MQSYTVTQSKFINSRWVLAGLLCLFFALDGRGEDTQTKETEWARITAPTVIHTGKPFEIKVESKSSDGKVMLQVDLHYSKLDGSYGGFFRWGGNPREADADTVPTVFVFTINEDQLKDDMASVGPVVITKRNDTQLEMDTSMRIPIEQGVIDEMLRRKNEKSETATLKNNQLITLGSNGIPRFVVKDITWPDKPGESEVCLWYGDKYAAVSITIDDNWAPDHKQWLELLAKHDLRATWFIITGRVTDTPSFHGTWDDYRKLLAAGHDVQSHTINHYGPEEPGTEEQYRTEYAGSIRDIEKNLQGHRCVAIAYPNGRSNRDVAQDYFIVARGVYGAPAIASSIDYMNTHVGGPGEAVVNSILGKANEVKSWIDNPFYKRAWIQPLYHGVFTSGKTDEERLENSKKVTEQIENIAKHKDLLWIDTFVNVAKYAQQRDSAALKVIKSGPDIIELSLSDLMSDDIFDHPLTIKIRLPDAWKTVAAVQNEVELPVKIVINEGAGFALVDAVPDRGNIIVTSK